MPRVSKKKKNGEIDGFFMFLASVVLVLFFAGIDFCFTGTGSQAVADVKSGISADVDSLIMPVFPTNGSGDVSFVSSFDPANPEPQCVFNTSKTRVLATQPVRLSWGCINADRCEISGLGAVPNINTEGTLVAPRRTGTIYLDCYRGNTKKSFGVDVMVFELTINEQNGPLE